MNFKKYTNRRYGKYIFQVSVFPSQINFVNKKIENEKTKLTFAISFKSTYNKSGLSLISKCRNVPLLKIQKLKLSQKTFNEKNAMILLYLLIHIIFTDLSDFKVVCLSIDIVLLDNLSTHYKKVLLGKLFQMDMDKEDKEKWLVMNIL